MERVIVLHFVLAGKHNQDGRADSVPVRDGAQRGREIQMVICVAVRYATT